MDSPTIRQLRREWQALGTAPASRAACHRLAARAPAVDRLEVDDLAQLVVALSPSSARLTRNEAAAVVADTRLSRLKRKRGGPLRGPPLSISCLPISHLRPEPRARWWGRACPGTGTGRARGPGSAWRACRPRRRPTGQVPAGRLPRRVGPTCRSWR